MGWSIASYLEARYPAVSEGVDEKPVVVTGDFGVAGAELYHLLDELLFVAAEDLDDLVLGLEAYDVRVGVLVRDTVNLGGRPAEVVEHRRHLLRLGEVRPVEILDVWRELGDATLPCFIESTTSFSRAWVGPSTSTL